ncbi:NAD(P)-dependent dehydrogenase (short-subunit alcohol dehydrogenase family) [Erwinia persicina]|uniref:SDR family NAD(P)-dependent oxidoreductase n=1 Tax=Erwinia aeris TaxID=3239803 RepID=A0ABV4E215_9GAMM|nr:MULTISPECIES: SDR family oxidoreductase [unclassified Erwinia]MCP1440732.1 NAD(P)-dependent dehydrogenase (short-subunit alcohol dehydrogenase family) [Erwinia persicina]MDN4627828.1 SDR family NAD(P)-dependent oxidoreductase [Erwinia sp. PsM31]MDN8539937.1 SDR family oxidoreductase [Erwinia sp. BC051422]
MKVLNENIAIVTGSNGGIGKEIVYSLLERNYQVFGLDLENDIVRDGFKFIRTDLMDLNALNENSFNDLPFGEYNLLINAAGIREIVPLLDLSLENWSAVYAINTTAPFLISRNFCRKLVAQNKEGSIVNIASVSGILAEPDRTAYVSSKHALIGLTKQFALEFGRQGIRCNSVSPAITRTGMTEHYFHEEATMKKIYSGMYSTRTGEPQDIAAVVNLLSDRNSQFINGANFVIDGGWTCGKDL